MNFRKLLIAGMLTLVTLTHSRAFEPLSLFTGHTKCWPSCVGKFCCDDYCGKPLPCAVAANCFECVDYCAKPLPCLPARKAAFCCNDFCPKPLPPIRCPNAKNLRCVPNRLPPIEHCSPKNAGKTTAGLVTRSE